MIDTSTMTRVGRKRIPLTGKGKTPREIFARNLSRMWGDRPVTELAELCGVTPDAASKWLRGTAMPDLDKWPALARALDLDSSTDLVTFG